MKRLMVPFMVLVFMVPFLSQPMARGREDSTLTPAIDGDIHEAAPVYTRDATDTVILVRSDTKYRGFIEWDTSSIPDAAIVEYVGLHIHTGTTFSSTTEFWSMESQPTAQPDNNAGNQVIYDDAHDGTKYYTSGAWAISTWYTVDLGATAITHLTGKLASDWFAVGLYGAATTTYSSSESAYDLELVVQWHLATDYAFTLGDPFYENATDAGTLTVHVTGDGFEEDHNVSADTTLYFPDIPTAFSWPVYSASRYVYVLDEENFTVTVPYDTIGVYSMTVKDKTATGGSAAAYLEAWRTIGGTEILVERMKITQGNPTPLNLMVGCVYHIKVLFETGSTYDWGYFTATSTTSVNIIVRLVEFSDGAQMLYGSVHVDGTRDGATITVDYLDDQNNTVWSNVTIRERNGPIVLEVPYSNSSYTMNWASANTSLGYTVTVEGQHTDFGVWGRSWIFDPSYTFPAFPVLTGIYGSASSDLLPFLLVAVVTLMFSYKWQAKGLLAGCLMASFLSLFGAASWSYYWLAFAWFIAIMVNINVGGEG